MAPQLHAFREMFQIRQSELNGVVTLALSGHIEEEPLSDLRTLLASQAGAGPTTVVLDLADVKLVNREAVHFLASCETAGVELKNCPSYVREWIQKGRTP
jgi:ABC-type transporter Mla MlaB component